MTRNNEQPGEHEFTSAPELIFRGLGFYKLKTKTKTAYHVSIGQHKQHSMLIGHQSITLCVPGKNCDKQEKALLVIIPGSPQNIPVLHQKDPDA